MRYIVLFLAMINYCHTIILPIYSLYPIKLRFTGKIKRLFRRGNLVIN